MFCPAWKFSRCPRLLTPPHGSPSPPPPAAVLSHTGTQLSFRNLSIVRFYPLWVCSCHFSCLESPYLHFAKKTATSFKTHFYKALPLSLTGNSSYHLFGHPAVLSLHIMTTWRGLQTTHSWISFQTYWVRLSHGENEGLVFFQSLRGDASAQLWLRSCAG